MLGQRLLSLLENDLDFAALAWVEFTGAVAIFDHLFVLIVSVNPKQSPTSTMHVYMVRRVAITHRRNCSSKLCTPSNF